jgi:hypothetical protein
MGIVADRAATHPLCGCCLAMQVKEVIWQSVDILAKKLTALSQGVTEATQGFHL